MKILKKMSAFLVAVAVASATIAVNATGYKPNYSVTGAVKDNDVYIVNDGTEQVTFEAEIKPEWYDENTRDFGGSVTVKVTASATDESGKSVSIGQKTSLNGHSGETQATAQVKKGESVTLKITVTLQSSTEKIKIKLSDASISCRADATPSPTNKPTPTPTDSHTATPTATAKVTPTPTKKPSTTYETTKDPYSDAGRVTNPPPTMPDNVSTDNLATQQPTEVPTATGESVKTKVNNDPAFGITVFFIILILLLAADIAVIVWRRKMGFTNLINGGVSRRKIGEDLCDYPDDDGSLHHGDDSFDNDLDE